MVYKGITINGLPIVSEVVPGNGGTDRFVVEYYESCVMAGVGSFIVPVTKSMHFEEAIRTKLVLEIAGFQAPDMAQEVDMKNCESFN